MSKKNKKYWQNRHAQWLDNQDKSDANTTAKLSKQYTKMSKEHEKEIASYFAKYGKDDVIEYRTLLESLSPDDRNLLYQSFEEFADKYPQHAHLMPVRESVYRLNRLQGLHYSTQLQLLELGAIEHEMMEKHLLSTYGKNYEYLMKELGLGSSFNAINNQIMMDTIYSKWVNNENFSDRIWANKSKMSNYIQTELRDAIARGDNYDSITRIMARRFDVGMYDTKRLVWTESSFVLNQSHTKAYVDAGVTDYTISAIRDSKTSKICRSLDGETFKFEDMEVGVNFPPFHVFCRSTFIGKLDDSKPIKPESVKDDEQSIVDKFDDSSEVGNITPPSHSDIKAKDNMIGELQKQNEQLKKENNIKEKTFTAKEIDNMSLSELRKTAEQVSKEYYLSGKSGISFGNADIDEVVTTMAAQGSKTSLQKDIKSIQRKLKEIRK